MSPAGRPRRVRPAHVLDGAAEFRNGPLGTVYVRSPRPLGPYPARLTDRLERWAGEAPARVFLAQRGLRGEWRTLAYADALTAVRAMAESLLRRRLDRPVVILSENSIEHALLALACMYCGIPYAPIAPAYSLASSELTTLRFLLARVAPAIVFAADGARFERPLAVAAAAGAEIVTVTPAPGLPGVPLEQLAAAAPTARVDEARDRVGPDTVAKILFTSGSTGHPKGVITTQRMLCSNQEMLSTLLAFVREEPPVLCDWLPWNHTFGGSHNFGLALYNGGTFYIDEGKPIEPAFAATVRNLRDTAPTAYFNVPKGYEMLVAALREHAGFAQRFFRSVDPNGLKIPARRAESLLFGENRPSFHAEPKQHQHGQVSDSFSSELSAPRDSLSPLFTEERIDVTEDRTKSVYPVNSREEFGVYLDMAIMRCVLTLALASATALGQEFEVASVKRNVLSDRVVSIRVDPGGSFNARGYSLKLLIQRAYDIKGYQVSGGPSWLDEDRWDVNARAPRSGSDSWKPEQINAMLRALLAERFGLKAHMTTKEMPGFVLLVARSGSKMKASSAAEEKIWRERADVVVEGATPASIAVLLGAYLAMPVRDQTGLEGRYDFRLHWTGRADSVSPVAEDNLSSSLPLPQAVIEQLGLKLQRGKVRTNILVIDEAQKASAN